MPQQGIHNKASLLSRMSEGAWGLPMLCKHRSLGKIKKLKDACGMDGPMLDLNDSLLDLFNIGVLMKPPQT